jgi:uncharacterized protein DUF1905
VSVRSARTIWLGALRESACVWTVSGEVWRHPGPGGWHFVTMPTEVADEVRARSLAKPFGSVPVRATVGATTWESSLFADTKSESYLLPVKADVRRRAGIEAGDTVTLTIVLTEPAA